MHNNNALNTPSYVSFYGMSRDPFGQKIEDDLFYAEPSRKQRLGTLLHLTQFGNELMIVTGPKGSGKTTLLQQFIATSPKSWKFARIEAQDGLDERKILQQLYRQMGMDFRGATHNDLLEQMKIQFDLAQRKGQYSIMLINNADLLPITAIKKVMEMASLISTVNKPLLRIVLFGTEALIGKLNDPLLNQYSSLPQRAIDLPPFSEEQTAHYVLSRLSAANFSNNDLFTPAAVHKLYTESYGWPARINELARNILTKSLPKNVRESMPDFDTKSFQTSRMLGLALTIAIVATFLFFQQDIQQWAGQFTSATSNSSGTSSAPQTKLAPTKIVDKPVTKPAITLVEKLKQRSQARLSETNTADKVKPVHSQPKAAAEQKPIEKQTPQPTVSINTIPRKESWVLNQNSKHYTLQIVAGENLNTIEEFIVEHKLYNNIAFYRSIRKNKPWYGLIYGVYPHKQAAVSAINKLPTKLQRLKPWVRSINSVQHDINKTRP